jgi:uncharacterized membrane-anchored protein YjiN (DUF445 family)
VTALAVSLPEVADPRRVRLSRMRALATGLLVLMAVVFVAASLAARQWPAAAPVLAYVRAFAEAAMVGACADWFAVTALFRRPLGLPIPHTAIIPRSKDRIGEALGRFIVENFLSPRVLDAKLRQLELAAWGGAWLQQPENARRVAARIVAWGPELLRILPAGALEEAMGAVAMAAARSVPAAPTASKLLAALWNDGRVQPLIERGAELLAAYVAEHQDVIEQQVQAQSWRWLPKFVDRAIARKITAGLLNLLEEMRDRGHPWRQSLAEAVERLIVRLAEDPEMRERGEALKMQLLEDPRLADHMRRLLADMRGQFDSGWAAGSTELEDRVAHWLCELGAWLRDSPALQRTLNTSARSLARSVLAPRRQDIGRFVAQVVASWDAKSVVERLELQIGPDLQFIRVNGTLVGGLVGLVLFTVSKACGLA